MARLAHRRIPNDGQITALVAHLFSGPHCGHALQGEHPPSSSVANGAEASPEAFDSRLPPRDVASEDGMFCPHIPKLDSSAPCFIQSRTLGPRRAAASKASGRRKYIWAISTVRLT